MEINKEDNEKIIIGVGVDYSERNYNNGESFLYFDCGNVEYRITYEDLTTYYANAEQETLDKLLEFILNK